MLRTIAMKSASALSFRAAMISLVVAMATTISAIAGTQADFTAVTTNPGNAFGSAILTMTTDYPASAFVSISDLIPGDSATRSMTLENTGSVPFTYTITSSSEGGPASLLWSDMIDGLQVSVSGDAGLIYSGPVSGLAAVASSTVVSASGTEVLTYVFSLPSSAGNAFQGLSQGIGITYDATQLAGQAR